MKSHQKQMQQQTNKDVKSKINKTTTTTTSSDIFEDVTQADLSSAVQTFDQSTKYHTAVQEPRLSSISVQDRKWFVKYKDHMAKGLRKTSMEEDRFKVSLIKSISVWHLLYWSSTVRLAFLGKRQNGSAWGCISWNCPERPRSQNNFILGIGAIRTFQIFF